MGFLEKIDSIYNGEREKYGIPLDNKDFSAFIPIVITDSDKTYRYTISKGSKAKLQFVDGNQYIYLSDIQIIETILRIEDKEVVEWFLHQFISLYNGSGMPTYFIVGGEKFEGCGIRLYPNTRPLMLLSDTEVDINCFCFYLNYIFYKDECYADSSKYTYYRKQTLCKYISIIDYYTKQSPKNVKFLKDIGFPLRADLEVEELEVEELAISKIFRKKNNIKKFAISAYL